jgi:hypothetical protein
MNHEDTMNHELSLTYPPFPPSAHRSYLRCRAIFCTSMNLLVSFIF